MKVTERKVYDDLLARDVDLLLGYRGFKLDHQLRVEIQKERFGKNNAEGNRKFYQYCLAHKHHICAECHRSIDNPSAINVSHRFSRGAHPEMAHDPRNVDILCARCHELWEHKTTRVKMNIYERVSKEMEKLRQEYNGNTD